MGTRFGGGTRDRTADLLHAMQALSQLSYTPNRWIEILEKFPSLVKRVLQKNCFSLLFLDSIFKRTSFLIRKRFGWNVSRRKNRPKPVLVLLAERTGLEPATPGVTGRYSNQLNYRSAR